MEHLAYAHQQNPPIIHRDIKPANIMIEEGSGRVVVMDFGIAKELGPSGGEKTQTGMVIGTVKYASPEQLRGEPLDGSADVYSLGMVLYELHTGVQLFAGLDDYAVIGKVLHDPQEYRLQFPRTAPAAFVSLLAKAVAKNRQHHYQRMADFLRDLAVCRPAGQTEDETETATVLLPSERGGVVVEQSAASLDSSSLAEIQPPALNFVGREGEFKQLQGWLEKALRGQRQVGFVTGEPGIGKTTLVDAFLEHVAVRGDIRVARGQCVEHYGAGEAYLPVLEALGRLCRGPRAMRLQKWNTPILAPTSCANKSGKARNSLQS
ncbi:MAG: serine/threonine-protein kinase [Candidatus Binatia bacterium]